MTRRSWPRFIIISVPNLAVILGMILLLVVALVAPFPREAGAPNADLLVVLTMAVLSLALVLVPFIPGVRDVPRWLPVHRLIWRTYYRTEAAKPSTPQVGTTASRPTRGA
jgi:hypothetical protein